MQLLSLGKAQLESAGGNVQKAIDYEEKADSLSKPIALKELQTLTSIYVMLKLGTLAGGSKLQQPHGAVATLNLLNLS